MTALALSVVLALVSAVCYAAGAILQEHVAATSPQQPYAPVRRGSWWAAVALNGVGGVLHVLALAYGPLSVVQPLGALTIVFALPMAALFVRRKVSATGWRGAVLATAGLAGLLSLTGPAPAEALADAERVAVTVATVALIAVLAGGARWVRRPGVRSVLLAAAAGTAFGISSVFTKNVAVAWAWDAWAEALPSLGMIGLLASAGVFLSQSAYRGAGLAAPLATATVVNPVVATGVGVAALGEHFRLGLAGTLLALGTAAIATAGLALLTTEGPAQPAEAAGVEAMGSAGSTGSTDASGPAAGPVGPTTSPVEPTTDPVGPAARIGSDARSGSVAAPAGSTPPVTPAEVAPGRVAAVPAPRARPVEESAEEPGQRSGELPPPILSAAPTASAVPPVSSAVPQVAQVAQVADALRLVGRIGALGRNDREEDSDRASRVLQER
ncbi:DMT family transporter [Streptomyces sp. LX-29]|uniref:DMT family transporter n=1 Tax=Streptomyces sp. LX-29 TaxID=2900152 RepID=UPI00240D9288|nr:DMT family transporter [Streptomyces sp. LX-29]WFB10994.1 DMT family transporter [Streptomyces sp. LX-29]